MFNFDMSSNVFCITYHAMLYRFGNILTGSLTWTPRLQLFNWSGQSLWSKIVKFHSPNRVWRWHPWFESSECRHVFVPSGQDQTSKQKSSRSIQSRTPWTSDQASSGLSTVSGAWASRERNSCIARTRTPSRCRHVWGRCRVIGWPTDYVPSAISPDRGSLHR